MQALIDELKKNNPNTNYSYSTTSFTIFRTAIEINDLKTLDILHELQFDIKTEFDNMVRCSCRINFDSFIYLEKFGVDILFHLNKVAVILYHNKDINGLRSCLEYGADVNLILSKTNFAVNIDEINCLLEYGVDLNGLNATHIESMIRAGGNNSLSVIKHLAENGLDLSKYLNHLEDLLLCVIYNDYHLLMEYLIQLRSDIDSDNILHITCEFGAIKCIEVLLNNGANIHINNASSTGLINPDGVGVNNASIINFIESNTYSYNTYNWSKIAKILIKYGAVINNATHTFCLYLQRSYRCKFDEELFTYFLDCGIDFNHRFDIDNQNQIEYILDAVVYYGSFELLVLCLKYGADPHINNCSPLKMAIKKCKFKSVKLLLDVGCILDSEFECETTDDIGDLLDQLGIVHKLTFMEKVD